MMETFSELAYASTAFRAVDARADEAESVQAVGEAPARSSKYAAGADFAQHAATSIRYGRVRYDGVLYVVIGSSEPIAGLDELCEAAVDRAGHSRYGTPYRSTWYGSLDPYTAISEAAYHVLADGDATVSALSLFQVRVRGSFADLHGRERSQPGIVGDDYAATQTLARRVRALTTLAGVLYPSARSSGTCLAVFARPALRSAKFVESIPVRRVTRDAIDLRTSWSAKWHRMRLDDLRRASIGKSACA